MIVDKYNTKSDANKRQDDVYNYIKDNQYIIGGIFLFCIFMMLFALYYKKKYHS